MRPRESELALGILAAVALGFLHRLPERHFAAQKGAQAGNADSAQRRQRRIEPARREAPDFLQGSLFHHPVETRVDADVEFFALRRQEKTFALRRVEKGALARAVKTCKRRPRGLENFQRAQDALRVAGAQPRGRFGIARAQSLVKFFRRDALGLRPHPRAHLRRRGGNIRQPVQKGLEIHAGAADEDRQLFQAFGPAQSSFGVGEPQADRIIALGADVAEKQVRNIAHFVRRRARRKDRQIAIDRHRVGVDHDAVALPREFNGARGLAAGRRSCQKDGLSFSTIRQVASVQILMTHVATLVGAPGAQALTPDVIAAAAKRLPGAAAPVILAPGEAADIPFAPGAAHGNRDDGAFADAAYCRAAASVLRLGLGAAPVDVFVQPAEYRRKKLLLADMDSTMIGQECVDELADFIGLKEKVAAITERAMRGEIAFEPALRERVALLAGLDASVVDKAIQERITLTPGGRALVQTMREHGAYTALVSGGFTLFTARIGEAIGFQENHANILLIENGRFSGRVAEPILGKAAKLAMLKQLTAARGLAPHETMAVGDGANDLAMLEEAGLGVAYRAKPAVAAAAQARVDHGDLTALLYAQGYRKQDFVA